MFTGINMFRVPTHVSFWPEPSNEVQNDSGKGPKHIYARENKLYCCNYQFGGRCDVTAYWKMLNISTFAISWLYTNTKATMKYCSFLMIYARPCGYTTIEETVLQEKRQQLTRSVSTTIKNRLPLFRKRKHLDWHRTRDVLCYFHVGLIWGSLAVWLFAVWKRQALIYCLQDDPHHCAGFCFKAVGYNWGRYVICLQHRN